MIEEPPLLTIAEKRNRPTASQIEALSSYPTGFIADAQNGRGALDSGIRPLDTATLPVRICAPVLTCDCGPSDILALLAALSEIQAGDALVVSTGDCELCAVTGDRVMGMAKNGGAAGLVTDGLVRDIEGIREVGLPVFCRGLSPNSPYGNGPGSVGLPVIVGGVTVASGDVLVSDENGAVVIPFADIDRVTEKLKQIATLETDLDAEVRDGLAVPEAIVELLKSERIARV